MRRARCSGARRGGLDRTRPGGGHDGHDDGAARRSRREHEQLDLDLSSARAPRAGSPRPRRGRVSGAERAARLVPGVPRRQRVEPDVSALPVHANSANYIASIGSTTKLHADFGGDGAYGIPYITVPGTQPLVPVAFNAYGDESDPGPYPIPLDAPIEGDGVGDAHVLAVDRDNCKLYELYAASAGPSGWTAASGAVFDLTSNALRPEGWTSADAAGLPIFPGLVRYDEVTSGRIDHALRFTVSTVAGRVPAPGDALRVVVDRRQPAADGAAPARSRPASTCRRTTATPLVDPQALKKYGMIVADNGSNWFDHGGADAGTTAT